MRQGAVDPHQVEHSKVVCVGCDGIDEVREDGAVGALQVRHNGSLDARLAELRSDQLPRERVLREVEHAVCLVED